MLIILVVSAVHAQFKTGDHYLTGSFSFATGKSESNFAQNQLNISFSPSFFKFKTDKKATGVRINSNYGESKNTSGSNTQTTDQLGLGLGIFSQNYFSLNHNFYFFIEKGISAGYSWSKTKESAFANNKILSTGYSATVYLKPGIGYKLTDRLIINLDFVNIAALTYGHSKTETTIGSTPTTTTKNNSFAFNSGLNNASLGDLGITFGLRLNNLYFK